MRRTKQVGIWSEMGSLWQQNPSRTNPRLQGKLEIGLRICAAITRASAASREDSHLFFLLIRGLVAAALEQLCKGIAVDLQKVFSKVAVAVNYLNSLFSLYLFEIVSYLFYEFHSFYFSNLYLFFLFYASFGVIFNSSFLLLYHI